MDKDLLTAYVRQPLLGVLIFQDQFLVRANPLAAGILGIEEVESGTWSYTRFVERVHPADRAKVDAWAKWELGILDPVHYRLKDAAGVYHAIEGHAHEANVGGVPALVLLLRDETNAVRLATHQSISRKVMAILNRPGLPVPQALTDILECIKTGLGVEAAGFRLRLDGQYTTFESAGAANLFTGPERKHCEPAIEGKDCLCGRIIRRDLPNLPCFSRGGSFVTDNYTADLQRIRDLTPLLTNRRCVRDQYSAIAHVPVRALGQSLGILHIANSTPIGLSPETARFLEDLGEFTGVVLVRHLSALAMKTSKENAEASNRAKDEFLATMSHEIRTPMNAILGFADLLSEAPLAAEYQEYLSIIKNRGQDLLSIIDDILDLARIEAEKTRLLDEPFRIREAITSAITLLRPRAEQKGLNLKSSLDSSIPEFVRGDALRLRQVLINLLSNAIKFTPTGQVELAVEVASPPRDNAIGLTFSVSDTGIGIATKDLQRIFEPFMQVESKRSRGYGGVGLGLNIVKHLVDRMGGRVQVESEVGRGSRFHFHLAFQLAGTRTPTGAHAQASGIPEPLSLLLVDDDITSRLLFGAMLRRDGHTVVEAADGEKAFSAARAGDFDLILMDVQMPILDGLAATQAIRGLSVSDSPDERRRSAVPIVALTAHAMRGDEEACLAAGMNGYLRKPLQAESLRACLRAYALSK